MIDKPKLQMIKHDELIFDYEGKGGKRKYLESKNFYEYTAQIVAKPNKEQLLKKLIENRLEGESIQIKESKDKNDELKKSNKEINSVAKNDFFV